MWHPFKRRSRGEPLDPALASAPAGEANYVVIDTELTGLDERRDTILSIGGIRAPAGRLDLGGLFYREVRPAGNLDQRSIVVHGITPSEVRDKPPIGEVLEDFLAFCGGDILVGHFIGIDLLFLHRALAGHQGRGLPYPAVDTWFLYEWMRCHRPVEDGFTLPTVRDPRLFELARALDVDVRGGHNALIDAFTTGQVFQRLLRRIGKWGLATVGEVLRAGHPGRPLHHDHDGAAPPLS